MKGGFTISDLEKRQREGKIRGFTQTKRKEPTTGGRIVSKHFLKKSKEKNWISWQLWYWTQQRGLVLQEEYKFSPFRKWKFDYFISACNVGIEYEGINSNKSRHTTVKGYTGDCSKYTEAAKMGIKVLRYTALNYKNVITDLNEIVSKCTN